MGIPGNDSLIALLFIRDLRSLRFAEANLIIVQNKIQDLKLYFQY